MPGALEIRLLGRFVVVRDGSEIAAADFGGRKVRALLRILTTRRGEFVSHDVLTEMLWGDRPPSNPVANVQVLVNRARRAVGRPDLLVTGPRGYSLAEGHDCVVDTEQFLRLVAAADAIDGAAAVAAYRDALAGWRGEPLSEDTYANWATEYRYRLTRARQQALERAAQLALTGGQVRAAVEFASTAAMLEPLREVAVLMLVRALGAAGDRVAALERYDLYRRALAEDLGLDPSEDAEAVQAELLRGDASSKGWQVETRRPRPDFAVLPFVGRSAELSQLLSVLEHGGEAMLAGASGTGKSRLLAELPTRTPVVSIRANLPERDEPWSLLRGVLREILAQDATAATDLPGPIRSAVAWLLPEFESLSDRKRVEPDPESRRSLLLEAATRMLAAGGVGLVVDDLQWADASSLWILEAVLSRLVHIGAVLAYRPDELVPGFAASSFVTRARATVTVIELRPLDVNDIAELSADDALTAVLMSATDRTPLAVTEVLRTLAAEDAVTPTGDGRWRPLNQRLLDRAREVALDGQRAAIISRAATQDPRARELLNLLALVAREVPARALALAAGAPERDVLEELGALSRSGLARLGEQGWATAHDMVSDVLVEALYPGDRGRLHAQLAGALDAVEPGDAEPSELARHWIGAGDTLRAGQAYRAASVRALDAFADGEAIVLAGAGLAVTPAPVLRGALLEIRAEARGRLGDIAGAREDLGQALRIHPRGPVRARLLGRLAAYASGADDLLRAAQLAELALVEAGADIGARARALEIASVLDMNLDRAERADSRAAEALALYQRLGDANGAARVLDSRAMASFLDGRIDDGGTLLDRAANLFEDSGDLVHVITPRSTAGHGLVFADRAEHGLQKTTAALHLARTIGHPEGQTYALWHTTEALAALNRGDEALDAGTEALAIATRIGHRGWTATAWRAVGIAHQRIGDPEHALDAFRNSLAASEHLNLFSSWAAARIALTLVELGRVAEAEPMVEQALSHGPRLGHFEGRLAEVELAAARADPGTAGLAQLALAAADTSGFRQGRGRLLAHLGGTV